MNKYNENLLMAVEDIEVSIAESDLDVSIALCNHYSKTLEFLEYSSMENTSELFDIFQESTLYMEADNNKTTDTSTNTKSDKKDLLIVRLIKGIVKLIKDFFKSIAVQIRGISRIVKNIFTHEEYVKGYKQNKKKGDQYTDLDMSGVPTFEEVPEINKIESKKDEDDDKKDIKDEENKKEENKKEENKKEENEIYQIVSIVQLTLWVRRYSQAFDNMLKALSSHGSDKDKDWDLSNLDKLLKELKLSGKDKTYKFMETYDDDPITIIMKLNSPIKSKDSQLNGKTKMKLFSALEKFYNDTSISSGDYKFDVVLTQEKENEIINALGAFKTALLDSETYVFDSLKTIKEISLKASKSKSEDKAA